MFSFYVARPCAETSHSSDIVAESAENSRKTTQSAKNKNLIELTHHHRSRTQTLLSLHCERVSFN